MAYTLPVDQKRFRWSEAKNKKLKSERNISFEEMLEAIAEGGLLDVLEHPNKKRYGRQKLFIVQWADYVYSVPFVETEKEFFLKTIIPSRKLKNKYRRKYEK